jgi:hypothetical protein
MVLDHPVVDRGFLQGGEVLALQVLDDRDLQGDVVVQVLDERRDRGKSGDLGRPPAPLSSNELELVWAARPDEDRLEDAVLANRRGQLLEGGLLEDQAWVLRVGLDPVERDVAHAARPPRPPRRGG